MGGLVELGGDVDFCLLVGYVLAPAKTVKRLTRWAQLDAFDVVDLVADEFEEAGHDLAQRRVDGGQVFGL